MKFDLGGGGTASGYIGVSAKEAYDKNKGYGFGQLDLVENVKAGGTGALSDAVRFHGGYGNFMVDLPKGVYKITVTTGNDYSSTITAEDVYQLLFMTGNNAVDSFTIPITDGQLNIYTTSGVEDHHSISTIEIEQTAEGTVGKPTIWLGGDSTVASYYNVSDDAKRGWGEYLHKYVDMDKYDIRNISVSGLRAWKLRESYFRTIEKYAKDSDILVLPIGINDYSDAYDKNTHTADPTNYIENITDMVQRAKAKGMTVYLVKQHSDLDTCFVNPPVEKMWFSDAIDDIAASEKVGVINMFIPWRDYCRNKGEEVAATYYNEGVHPNAKGADKLAEIAAQQMFTIVPTPTPTKTPAPTPSATPTSNPNFIHKKFDLGGNGTANGYIGVSASETYDKTKGYGFNQKSYVQDLDAPGEGALSDAVHFNKESEGYFIVDLPKGVYKITVITGRDECSNILAEGNIQLLNLTGNNAKDSFTIPITDGCLNISAIGGGGRHSLCTVEIEQTSNDTTTKPTIWICGDSTAASYYNTSEKSKRGWGEYLNNYVDMDTYDVRNLSIKSSESLQDTVDTYFKTVDKYGKSGDILVLAHGINDYTDAYAANSNSPSSTAYVKNMTNLVRRGKQNGMKVYLVKQHCNLKTNFKYPLVEKMWFSDELDSIAASEKVNILDLFNAWREFCLQKGRVLADTYYNEDFYLNKYGADKMAELANEILFPSGEQGGPSYIDPYPDFDSSATNTYEAAISGGIITNPHKGYVMEVHSKDMLYSGKHHLGIDGSDGNRAWDVISTCCSVLYWKNINPAEGKYDFSEIDTMLEACEQAGMTYAIRIIPYSTGTGSDSNYGATHDFVPQWVYKKGAKKNRTKYKWRDSSVEIDVPDWSDPVYIQAYKDLLAALAKKYDNDPRVEYIENRAFGNMGEWHTGEFTANFMPSVEIQKDMLDYYAATFKNTTCSVFVDAREVYDYANSLGFAKRNDGFILEPNTEWTLVPSYRANVPTMADNHNTYEYMLHPDDSSYISWSEQHYRECIEISHLTFMAIDQDSGCGAKIYSEHKDLIDEMCNKIGYNFTVTSAKRKGNKLKVKIKNIGLAPAFFDIDLCAEIIDSNGNKKKIFGEPVHIEKGTFHDGDERAYMFEYNGTFDESSTICLAMYESSKYKSTSELISSKDDPTVRFDNKNNLANKRLKLVKK
ncbi:MAG: beta-galactosidase [Lachnospiraceae bacterium]|nr:beta-galactosidase [Lachnospiraceae bacterium]